MQNCMESKKGEKVRLGFPQHRQAATPKEFEDVATPRERGRLATVTCQSYKVLPWFCDP